MLLINVYEIQPVLMLAPTYCVEFDFYNLCFGRYIFIFLYLFIGIVSVM